MGVYSIMEIFGANQKIEKPNQKVMDEKNAAGCVNINNDSNDREEGEIIDDFELILSSEEEGEENEEHSVRERIKQLEATNIELEQIARISESQLYEYNFFSSSNTDRFQSYQNFERNIRVSEASSISSGEFQTPKKKKRHKKKRNKGANSSSNSKHCGHGNRRDYSHHRRENKRLRISKKGQNMQLETILIDSYESLSDEERINSHNYKHSRGNAYDNLVASGISREELRFALATDHKHREAPIGSLRDRLAHKTHLLSVKNNDNDQNETPKSNKNAYKNEITVVDSESEVDSLKESELRLIALKSAVLKKHYLRKMRNAEAYSPTDFIECNQQFENTAEIEAIDDVMEISPAESPVPVSSPQNEETSVNTRPIDMDIVMSDSDDGKKSIYNWISQQSELNIVSNLNNINPALVNGLPYPSYVPQMTCCMNQIQIDDETPPPPPPFFIEEDEAEKYIFNCITNAISKQCDSIDPEIQTISMENSQEPLAFEQNREEIGEEEEEALRALLLSTCKSSPRALQKCDQIDYRSFGSTITTIPQNSVLPLNTLQESEIEQLRVQEIYKNKSKSIKNTPKENRSESSVESNYIKETRTEDLVSNKKVVHDAIEDDEDAEQLRSFLLRTMSNQKNNRMKTQSPVVLKEAVRRFQVNSEENSPYTTSNHSVEFGLKNNGTKQLNYKESRLKSKNNIESKTIHSKVNGELSVQTFITDEILSEENFSKQNECEQIISETKSPVNILTNSCNQSLISTLIDGNSLADKIVISSKETLQKLTQNTSPPHTTSTPTPMNGLNVVKTQPTKIVKPNKVINKNVEAKRKNLELCAHQQSEKKRKSSLNNELDILVNNPLNSARQNSGRLVTKAEISNYKVPKLIIAIGNSESETDDHNSFSNDDSVSEHRSSNSDSMALKTYCDNASPMSLPMDSPCETPSRSNTPTIETTASANLRKSIMNEYFEKKLDDFLKQHRSQVEKSVGPLEIRHPKLVNKKTKENDKMAAAINSSILRNHFVKMSTPLAVRHLSAASQAEYRRLIHRMQLLEKRKALRINSEKINKFPSVAINKLNISRTSEKGFERPENIGELKSTDIPPKILQSINQNSNITMSSSPLNKNVNLESEFTEIKDIEISTPFQRQMSSLTIDKEFAPINNTLPKTRQSYDNVEMRCVNDVPLKTIKNSASLSMKKSTEKLGINSSDISMNFPHETYKKIDGTDQLTTKTDEIAAELVNKMLECNAGVTNVKIQESPISALSSTSKPIHSTILESPTKKQKCNITSKDQLRTLESSYLQIGVDMISHLNNSLVMVEQAKLAKIARLRHCQRLKELYVQIAEEKRKIKLEQTKMSKIQPKIHSSHATVIAQKKRRNKLYEAAVELGRSVNGNEYRLNDEAKVEIARKSNQLTHEIRLVNSLVTYSDLIKSGTTIFSGRSFNRDLVDNIECKNENSVNVNENIVSVIETHTNTSQPIVENNYKPNREDVSENGMNSKVLVRDNIVETENIEQFQLPVTQTLKVSGKSIEKCKNVKEQTLQTALEIMPRSDIEKSLNSTDKFVNGNHIDGLSAMSPKIHPTVKTTAKKSSTSRRLPKNFEDVQKKTEYTEPNFTLLSESSYRQQQNSFQEYISPLTCIKGSESCVDSNRLVCPYDLMGNCEDKDCQFLHLNHAECF